MNIDQYRAIKAQEQQQTQEVEQPAVVQEVKVETPQEQETKVEENVDKPNTVNINGEEITIDELTKGYLRQSDYTRKTQEIANQRKEVSDAVLLYETLKNNPEATEAIKSNIKIPSSIDPTQARVIELEQKVFDMMLDNEITKLQNKYPDFEVMEVLEVARDKKLTNLEDAYKLSRSINTKNNNVDIDKLKEQLRKEIQEEIKSTSTVISNNGYNTPSVRDNSPKLSPSELKVANGFGMTANEYVSWKNKNIKK